ncbi:MAG: Nif3-like dinuclear metal center hexameric protein [Gammaproteobacteria bacterium]|nr:Nif3-like dinuclear metal center hexameric protein [Gammaproteobacteria bacterium]
MAKLLEIVEYADNLLEARAMRDYCPNGLQIEGRTQVAHIVTAVTASRAVIEAAIEAQADALLVHHGYFWRGEASPLVGIKYRRIRELIRHDISLIAYHLPLDVHPVHGNNAQLAPLFGATPIARHAIDGVELIQIGELAQPMTPEKFGALLTEKFARVPLHIPGESAVLRRIAWCSGAAQDYIDVVNALAVDAYISGEVSERTYHSARELGLHYFAAGHHATERYGVQALGTHLAQHFGLTHRFIDEDNPV